MKNIHLMDDRTGTSCYGDFRMPDGTEVRGELTLQRGQTLLNLYAPEFFCLPSEAVTGVLYDRTRVSLMNCVSLRSGSATRGGGHHFSASIFPHLVLFGDECLTPEEKRIVAIHFMIDDASTLFHDYTSFGEALRAEDHVERIIEANRNVLGYEERATVGPSPELFYFTGKREIFRAETALGVLSASNNPTYTFPGPDGFSVRNRIFVSIEIAGGISADEATARVVVLLRFIEIMVGRPQNILHLQFQLDSVSERPIILDAYWTMPPERLHKDEKGYPPHHVDALIYAADEPDYFGRVLTKWLSRQVEWQESRMRFATCFAGRNRYDIDRLIAAANMFDILPASALPPETSLPDDLADAHKRARQLFRALKRSPERDSVLGALGRIGKHVLKRKVRHRAEVVQRVIGSKFPDLEVVLDQAIDLRNHFVHGSDSDLSPYNRMVFLSFFTEALQFVFAASDLIECGWDIEGWSQQGTTGSHPFSAFRVYYATNLELLRAVLPTESTS